MLKQSKAKFLIPLILLAVVFGCGENRPGTVAPGVETQKFMGQDFLVLSSDTLAVAPDKIQGTGSLVFKEARKDEDNSYSLQFSLQDKGSVTLTTNANAKLQSGVNLTLARDGATLVVTMFVGSESYDVSSDFTSVVADGNLNFTIEVHGHGHLITTVGEDKFEYAFTTKVPGRLWGLTLKDATVTKAEAGKATEEH